MRNRTTLRALLSLAAVGILAACGGGDDDAGAGIASYPAVLAKLNTSAGLTDPAIPTVIDDGYRDAGVTKAQVVDALAQESAALAATPTYTLFPQVTLSDATLTNCDAANICTLTGTLRNADADDTSIPFSTKAVRVGNSYRLLGDQATS